MTRSGGLVTVNLALQSGLTSQHAIHHQRHRGWSPLLPSSTCMQTRARKCCYIIVSTCCMTACMKSVEARVRLLYCTCAETGYLHAHMCKGGELLLSQLHTCCGNYLLPGHGRWA